LRRTLAGLGLAAVLLLASGQAGVARGTDDSAFILTLFVQRYFAAFNRHDAAALARVFSGDGELTDAAGQNVRGREAIEAAARSAFGSVFKDAEIHFVRIDTRQLARDLVALDVRWWIFGATAPHWGQTQYGLSAWIAAKRDGEWQILAAHEQLIDAPATPAPSAPPQ
jgi:uncharacterized protein (TIGR02246 family)